MELNDKFREEQRRRQVNMHMMRDIIMAIIILGIGFIMFFGKQYLTSNSFFEGIDFKDKDPVLLNLFGGLCFLYGSFRMYTAIRRKY